MGIDLEIEVDQPLADSAARLHPQLHHAFADRLVVLILRHMADVETHQAGSLSSRG